MPRGGPRPGAGRKTKTEELAVRNIAIQAVEETYGSLLDGFKHLLQSDEPGLVKWAWGHAVGNPREFVDIDMAANIEQIQVIQLPDNGRDAEIISQLPIVQQID